MLHIQRKFCIFWKCINNIKHSIVKYLNVTKIMRYAPNKKKSIMILIFWEVIRRKLFPFLFEVLCGSCGESGAKWGPVWDSYLRQFGHFYTFWPLKKLYRAVGLAGLNFQKKVSFTKKLKIRKRGWNTFLIHPKGKQLRWCAKTNETGFSRPTRPRHWHRVKMDISGTTTFGNVGNRHEI